MSNLIALAISPATVLNPHSAYTQQPVSLRRIGVLFGALSSEGKEAQAFRQGLLDLGYAEGRDVTVEWRTASGDYARFPELAAELVERKVEVIVAGNTLAAQALKRVTSTIPIVMAVVSDPVDTTRR